MAADEAVAKAIDAFADALDHPDLDIAPRNASMDLARACRQSLGDSWSADLHHFDKSKLSGTR